MSYQVEFTPKAIEGLEALTSTIQQRVLDKIRWLADNFENLTPSALTADFSGLFKLKVGNYRVIYSFDVESELITIQKIGHRRDVYN